MFTIVGLMLLGVTAGYLLRRFNLSWVSKVITLLIWLLLFLLGREAGGNPQVISGLTTLGLEAVIISLLATLGSLVGAWLLWRNVSKKGGEV